MVYKTMIFRKGYAAAFFGTVVGAPLIGALGLLGLLVPCEAEGFECLGVAIVVVVLILIGATIGSVLGCYLGLRLTRQPCAGRTAWTLVLLELVIGAAGAVIANSVPDGVSIPLPLWSPWFLGLPLLARWLALRGVDAVEG